MKTFASEASIHGLCELKGLIDWVLLVEGRDDTLLLKRRIILKMFHVSGLVMESLTELLLKRRHVINTDFNYCSNVIIEVHGDLDGIDDLMGIDLFQSEIPV